MSQKLKIVKDNGNVDDDNDPKIIDIFHSPLEFDLMIDPLFGSWFKLPVGEYLGVESLCRDDSSMKSSSFLVKSILNNVSSTSSDSSTSSYNTIMSSNNDQPILNTYPSGLTISTPMPTIVTSFDHLTFTNNNYNS
jgi:hypothetical protein